MKDLLERPTGRNRHGHEKNPDSAAKKCTVVKCAGDPVDVATGRMLLPQTDIALPGSLPLVFERVFDSSYRGGRWFGHGWSSTVDQRLEIDAEGVVFSCNEGSLLAYPHPAPGAPVMPTHGRRWPLDRVDGGYTITDPEAGCVRHFVDHPAGELALLAQIDDRNGCWISFEYDDLGTPTSIVHHGGYRLKLTTHDGRVTALHLAGAAPDGSDQEILRYGYTEGHLTEVTNSSGTPLRFDYDELGRITAWTDTNGSRYEYSYDEHDRCVYQTGANGHLEAHFAWDDIDPATGLRMTSTTDGLGNTTRYVINARSQVVAEINALGVVTRYEYDRYHRLLSVTDPLGHTTRSSYDEQGRLTSVSRPDGRELTAEYNTLGLPVRVKSADGTVIRQTYDERGNRTSITDASDATTTYAYDGAGRITSVTDALGHRTSVRCDAAGLLAEITDPLGATTRYERDAYGRPVAITDALRTVTWFAWTPEGNLAHRVDPDGSRQSWTYDGEGNCLSHTDSMGGVTTFEYSDFDLLVARTGPDSARHEFGHDSLLRLTEVTSPQGLRWSYTYDAVGRLVRERDFDGRTLVYTYDAASRLVSRTNGAGQIIRFERNELGQLLRKYVDGTLTRYEYDDFDQLAVASGPDVTLTRIRDRHGRLKFEGVNGRCLTFKHDALGRRISRTTPAVSSARGLTTQRAAVTSSRHLAVSSPSTAMLPGRSWSGISEKRLQADMNSTSWVGLPSSESRPRVAPFSVEPMHTVLMATSSVSTTGCVAPRNSMSTQSDVLRPCAHPTGRSNTRTTRPEIRSRPPGLRNTRGRRPWVHGRTQVHASTRQEASATSMMPRAGSSSARNVDFHGSRRHGDMSGMQRTDLLQCSRRMG